MVRTEDLLKQVTTDIVIDIMKENGSDLYGTTTDGRTKQKCLWFRTICHGGDSHKLCYFTETKDFYCYTSCGRMKFWELIKRIRNATDKTFYEKVVLYIAKKVGSPTQESRIGFSNPDEDRQLRSVLNEMLNYIPTKRLYKKETDYKITNFYDDTLLKYFEHDVFYESWLDEGISPESMRKYEICWYEDQEYIIIPHRDIKGRLVGIRRRSFNPRDKNNKYMPLIIEGKMYDHPLSLNVYGLYYNKEAIKKSGIAVIMEGEKSVLKGDTYFGKDNNIVATCGFNVSEWQLDALIKAGAETIVLGFDKDFDDRLVYDYEQDSSLWKEYQRYKERIKILAQRIASRCKVFVIEDKEGLLGPKDSPVDKGKEVYQYLFDHKKKIYMPTKYVY